MQRKEKFGFWVYLFSIPVKRGNTKEITLGTSFEILVLFQKLHAEGRTLIFVTHNPEIAQYSSRNIRLRDGHVVEDTVNPQILSAAAALAALPKNDED